MPGEKEKPTIKTTKKQKEQVVLIKIKDARAVAIEAASRGYTNIESYIDKTLYLPGSIINIKYRSELNAIEIELLIKIDDDSPYVVSNHLGIDDARYYLKDIDYLLDWNQKYLEDLEG